MSWQWLCCCLAAYRFQSIQEWERLEAAIWEAILLSRPSAWEERSVVSLHALQALVSLRFFHLHHHDLSIGLYLRVAWRPSWSW
jgi:hypothetical protein